MGSLRTIQSEISRENLKKRQALTDAITFIFNVRSAGHYQPHGSGYGTHWFPDSQERCECCDSIDFETIYCEDAWAHCCSLEHVRNFVSKHWDHDMGCLRGVHPDYPEESVPLELEEWLLGANGGQHSADGEYVYPEFNADLDDFSNAEEKDSLKDLLGED